MLCRVTSQTNRNQGRATAATSMKEIALTTADVHCDWNNEPEETMVRLKDYANRVRDELSCIGLLILVKPLAGTLLHKGRFFNDESYNSMTCRKTRCSLGHFWDKALLAEKDVPDYYTSLYRQLVMACIRFAFRLTGHPTGATSDFMRGLELGGGYIPT